MSAIARLVLFALVLIAVFAGGAALGSAIGPLDGDAPAPAHGKHPR